MSYLYIMSILSNITDRDPDGNIIELLEIVQSQHAIVTGCGCLLETIVVNVKSHDMGTIFVKSDGESPANAAGGTRDQNGSLVLIHDVTD